jgi:uncharacterized protein
VIADATWVSAGHRAAATAAARSLAADLVQLQCVAPPDLIARQVADRAAGPSDGGPEMAREQEAWPEAITIDTSGADPAAIARAVRQAIEAIRPPAAEHPWRPSRPYMLPG